MGYGIWDMGYGIWDMGYGIWDMGYGIMLGSGEMIELSDRRTDDTESVVTHLKGSVHLDRHSGV